MSLGKHEDQVKQDDTRVAGEITNSETTEEERLRIGTVVDTRAASAGASAAPAQSGSAENDGTRNGTMVDIRGDVGGGGDKPVTTDRMRDGS